MNVIKGVHESIIRGGQFPENDLVSAATGGWWVSGENSGVIDSLDTTYSGLITVDLGINCYIYNEDTQYDCLIQGSVPILGWHYGDDTEYTCYISGAVYTPEVNFTGSPQLGVRPLTVVFTDTTSYPAGFSGVWRQWNFGDPYGSDNILAGSGMYETVTHVYPINGRYSVTLQVKMCKI